MQGKTHQTWQQNTKREVMVHHPALHGRGHVGKQIAQLGCKEAAGLTNWFGNLTQMYKYKHADSVV